MTRDLPHAARVGDAMKAWLFWATASCCLAVLVAVVVGVHRTHAWFAGDRVPRT